MWYRISPFKSVDDDCVDWILGHTQVDYTCLMLMETSGPTQRRNKKGLLNAREVHKIIIKYAPPDVPKQTEILHLIYPHWPDVIFPFMTIPDDSAT